MKHAGRKLPKGQAPLFNQRLESSNLPFTIMVTTDGKTTRADLYYAHAPNQQHVACGYTRRKPGDRWDVVAGSNLALARLFEAAARNYRESLLRSGHEDMCGLPRSEIRRIKAEMKQEKQERYRGYQEAIAAFFGGVSPIQVEDAPLEGP